MAEPNVLLADDDSAIRTVISRALTRQGYRIQATGTAATLWRWIEDGTGDVAILDVVLSCSSPQKRLRSPLCASQRFAVKRSFPKAW
jgi:DNA-binding NtrC family response regulator